MGGHLLGWRTVCAVEFAAYPRSVLLARQRDGMLPRFPVWDDVRTFDGKPWRGRVDIVTRGFPCQDISVAGKGDGLDGERSGLWTEMARIIGEVQPRFAFVENSPMLTSRGLDRVLGDLSTLGYDAVWGVVGASDAGAPHRRERIWILAYANSIPIQFIADSGSNESINSKPDARTGHIDGGCGKEDGQHPIGQLAYAKRERLEGTTVGCVGWTSKPSESSETGQHPIGQLANPDLCGRIHGQAEVQPAAGGFNAQREPQPSGEDVADAASSEPRQPPEWTGWEDTRGGSQDCRGQSDPRQESYGTRGWWSTEPGLGGMADELADRLDIHGTPEPGSVPRVATGIPKRADRIKAIGNGQVPAALVLAWNTLIQRIA